MFWIWTQWGSVFLCKKLLREEAASKYSVLKSEALRQASCNDSGQAVYDCLLKYVSEMDCEKYLSNSNLTKKTQEYFKLLESCSLKTFMTTCEEGERRKLLESKTGRLSGYA